MASRRPATSTAATSGTTSSKVNARTTKVTRSATTGIYRSKAKGGQIVAEPGTPLPPDPSVPVGRRTVSMPADLLAAVEALVGPREFSGYVARAVQRQVSRDNLKALLAEWPEPDAETRANARAELDAALKEAFAVAERSARPKSA